MIPFLVLSLLASFRAVRPGVVLVEGRPDETQVAATLEQRIREWRIEVVKFQILSNLKLEEAPQLTSSESEQSREAVQLLLQDSTEESPHRDTLDRTIVPVKGGARDCLQTNVSGCEMFHFDLGSAFNASALDLWIYRAGEVPKRLSVSLTHDEEGRNGTFYFEAQRKGWNKFRLLSSLSLPWNDTVECSVEIVGRDTEPDGGHRPYLMASQSPPATSRHRRDAAECDTSEHCCKKPLRLSFAEIGFHFIVYPEAFEANMCVGRCRLDHSTLRTHYERALVTTIEKNGTLGETLGECWTLSCKPKELKEVRVIYKDMENLHHDQYIRDLSVESCSCS